MSVRICTIILTCIFSLSAFAQPDLTSAGAILEKNQKVLGKYVALVWKDGKIIYQKETGIDFTAKTQAPIAASTGWLTAAVVLTFVDEGKISLDDPVGKYIPAFNKYMKRYLTVRQCLLHLTGFERDKGLNAKTGFGRKYQTLEDQVNDLASKEIINNAGKLISMETMVRLLLHV